MIQLSNVTKQYKSGTALKGLTLQIDQGQIYALLGSNGAGKTTTINLLLGFLNPTSGEVTLDGLSPFKDRKAISKRVAYIPENVSLYPYLTGVENLDYFCSLAGIKKSKQALKEILTKCGLQSGAHTQKVAGYSKGMRQKVGIAIAYAKEAKVLLLDEPASGLDPAASNELTMLLKQLAKEGATILMASHDLFRVREISDRIGILKKGELVRELKAETVSANELEKVYLDYMQA
ncbi:ABC transporter ATP-binding protein [Marivirga lumbricoides]|uniref:ABC transporter ATP-binding protein n=1 Tax=Marivirga lumbricoides TaxID=1046115 RepID=A0ABQ1N5G4_9BACT|nr:ABC transporter ATP-binding protein [Marivirga lumbricoides]